MSLYACMLTPADDCMAVQVLPDKRMADKKSSVERGVQHQASLTWTTGSGGEGEEHHSVEQVPAHMLPTIGIAKRRVRTQKHINISTDTKDTYKAHTHKAHTERMARGGGRLDLSTAI